MAVKPTGGQPDRPKDVDDQIADRRRGEGRAPAPRRPPPKAVPRKPGHLADGPGDHAEEPVAEPEALQEQALAPREEEAERARQRKDKKRDRRGGGDQPEPDDGPPAPSMPHTTPAHLVHDSNYYRSQSARKMGFEQTPSVGDFITGLDSPSEGEALGAILPSARARAHPDLPETDIRPPDFLTPLEAMKDVWMQTRGRITRRTQELLEGVDLEDMLQMLTDLFENEALLKRPDGRLVRPILDQLGDEPGPLLTGFSDPRLTELWRLFLDDWEIWVPDGEEEGVELFWEGEAEDDDGAPIEIVQALTLIGTDLILSTKLGDLEDTITFDGEAFYRLKTARG